MSTFKKTTLGSINDGFLHNCFNMEYHTYKLDEANYDLGLLRSSPKFKFGEFYIKNNPIMVEQEVKCDKFICYVTYEKHMKHGPSFARDYDGNLRCKFNFKHDKKYGEVLYFRKNGRCMAKGYFNNDNGTIYYYNHNGNIRRSAVHVGNVIISENYYD